MFVFTLDNKLFILITVTFRDHETAARIIETKSLTERERLGRQVQNFKEVWKARSVDFFFFFLDKATTLR